MKGDGISERKADHIELAAKGDVGFQQTTTLFECVRFVHQALPELSANDIDTSLSLFGKELRAPLVIASMTGGVDKAEAINRELAALAEARGYGFGLGSQRAMHLDASKGSTYHVREVAPTVLVLGNLGLVPGRRSGLQGRRRHAAAAHGGTRAADHCQGDRMRALHSRRAPVPRSGRASRRRVGSGRHLVGRGGNASSDGGREGARRGLP